MLVTLPSHQKNPTLFSETFHFLPESTFSFLSTGGTSTGAAVFGWGLTDGGLLDKSCPGEKTSDTFHNVLCL